MHRPKQGYLKCYYGYKNFGDEMLAFGVINRIFRSHPTIETLYIEVGNKERFDSRLDKNSHYIDTDLCKVETIQKNNYWRVLTKWLCNPKALKFLGWGELFTEARGRFYGWWNYALLFWADFLRKNVIMLGGFWTPTTKRLRLLYKLTVNKCQQILVREQSSYEVIANYLTNKRVNLVKVDDFSTEVVKKWQSRQKDTKTTKESQNIALINLTPYRQTETDIDAIRLSVHVWWHCLHVYFPCWQEDVDILWQLKVIIPGITAYYRRLCDVDTILTYMSTVSTSVWSRLHFLYILHLLGVKATPIVYQEKITKFMEEYGMGESAKK